MMDSLVYNYNGGSDNHESNIEFSSANLSGDSLIGASCQDPSLSLVGVNKSSSHDSPTESSHETVQNMNQDNVFLLHQNENMKAVTEPAEGTLGSSDEMFHEDENFPETIATNSHSRKPGVILLGRGNSFSLGRSEVILLHTNRQKRRNARRNDNSKYLSLIEDSDNIQNNNNILENWNNVNLNEPDILSPVSNEISQVVTNQTQQAQKSKFVPGELETLWQKAELIMAAKETVVQQVLEEFGIGEVGSPGDEGEEKVMEETIWQAVQDNFHI